MQPGYMPTPQERNQSVKAENEENERIREDQRELIHLIETVEHHSVCALFAEINGSSSAASVISAETGIPVFTLDMAMSGDSWFDAMYHNINTLKEALS